MKIIIIQEVKLIDSKFFLDLKKIYKKLQMSFQFKCIKRLLTYGYYRVSSYLQTQIKLKSSVFPECQYNILSENGTSEISR